MKRTHIPGLINLFEVNDPKEIDALARDPRIDRQFDTRTCPLNWLLLKRSLSVLSFEGRRFPTMTPRGSANRELYQHELSARLTARAADIRKGSAELAPLATWITGVGSDALVGVLTQQLLGDLFARNFAATQESWSAAEILVAAPRSSNLPRMLWWFLTGKVRRAKRLLAGMVDGDLSAVNAIGIASHNVVKGLRHMRLLYSDVGVRSALSAEAAASQCLFAPLSLYRQATAAGELGGCPYPQKSLFVLAVGEASRRDDGHSLVFMDESWSQCPAAEWVPAMLEGVWRRASSLWATPRIPPQEDMRSIFPTRKI